MEHNLKTIQPYFDDIKTGKKNFELRENDRNFQIDDIIHLLEYDKSIGYTGKIITKKVKYVLKDCPQFGLHEAYCILGLK
jgi:ASC-1-like (ASCH) protein